LSEILWSPRRNKDYSEFLSRLKTQNKRHDLMKIKYNNRNPIE
jgi:N-acetyl-beta-hexosaminidase